jgi:hypothetical protein
MLRQVGRGACVCRLCDSLPCVGSPSDSMSGD